jgi:hypothetical protein
MRSGGDVHAAGAGPVAPLSLAFEPSHPPTGRHELSHAGWSDEDERVRQGLTLTQTLESLEDRAVSLGPDDSLLLGSLGHRSCAELAVEMIVWGKRMRTALATAAATTSIGASPSIRTMRPGSAL